MLCEEIIVSTFVERIEVHDIFIWPSSFELKRGFYISAFASFVCANFRSERTKQRFSTHGSNVPPTAVVAGPIYAKLRQTETETPELREARGLFC